MTGKKFMGLLLVLFTIAATVYFITMPRGNNIPLTGVIDGPAYEVGPPASQPPCLDRDMFTLSA